MVPRTEPAEPLVLILMGVYNGADFLTEQLASIASQTHHNWVLLVSDDGSSDRTRELLEDFRAQWGGDRVLLRDGPRNGFLENFLSLACRPEVSADYYAFSDQDDVWAPTKIEHALERLRGCGDRPGLYCSRTSLIDEAGRAVGASPLFRRSPCFRNALVQSIAGGNTMVFNEPARKLLALGGEKVQVPSHDWWLYLLVSGAGGEVVYDAWPSVGYRQHDDNLVGGNVGWRARARRMLRLIDGQFRRWNDMHCVALSGLSGVLTAENRELLQIFCRCRQSGPLGRLRGIVRIGAFRQTRVGNIALFAASVLNRF